MDPVMRHAQAGARDRAVQKLRDMTLAIAILATGGVGVIAWLSAAGIPGSNVFSSLSTAVAAQEDDQPTSSDDGIFQAAPPTTVQQAPAFAVTGGSHPKP
jgi:hypothetical protein